MKLILVFALFGATCCLAVPSCSKNEIEKCTQGPPVPTDTEEEVFDKLCREIGCWVDIADRCGDDIMGFPINGHRRMVKELCPRDSPLRRKYLDNYQCITKYTKDYKDVLINQCGVKDFTKEEFCSNFPDTLRCVIEYIIGKCGYDAAEVVLVSPGIDPYDCQY